jgi:hypothetical protein
MLPELAFEALICSGFQFVRLKKDHRCDVNKTLGQPENQALYCGGKEGPWSKMGEDSNGKTCKPASTQRVRSIPGQAHRMNRIFRAGQYSESKALLTLVSVESRKLALEEICVLLRRVGFVRRHIISREDRFRGAL